MRTLILGLLFTPLAIAQPLSGRVTSAEEGAMEGVLVSAKKVSSTVTVTVVSDAEGRYRFPDKKLAPGKYTLSVRAVGYELDGPSALEVLRKGTTRDIQLKKTG